MTLRLVLRHHFTLPEHGRAWAGPDTRARGGIRTWPSHSSILKEKNHANFLESLLSLQTHCTWFGVLSIPLEPIEVWELPIEVWKHVNEFLMYNQGRKRYLNVFHSLLKHLTFLKLIYFILCLWRKFSKVKFYYPGSFIVWGIQKVWLDSSAGSSPRYSYVKELLHTLYMRSRLSHLKWSCSFSSWTEWADNHHRLLATLHTIQ